MQMCPSEHLEPRGWGLYFSGCHEGPERGSRAAPSQTPHPVLLLVRSIAGKPLLDTLPSETFGMLWKSLLQVEDKRVTRLLPRPRCSGSSLHPTNQRELHASVSQPTPWEMPGLCWGIAPWGCLPSDLYLGIDPDLREMQLQQSSLPVSLTLAVTLHLLSKGLSSSPWASFAGALCPIAQLLTPLSCSPY